MPCAAPPPVPSGAAARPLLLVTSLSGAREHGGRTLPCQTGRKPWFGRKVGPNAFFFGILLDVAAACGARVPICRLNELQSIPSFMHDILRRDGRRQLSPISGKSFLCRLARPRIAENLAATYFSGPAANAIGGPPGVTRHGILEATAGFCCAMGARRRVGPRRSPGSTYNTAAGSIRRCTPAAG